LETDGLEEKKRAETGRKVSGWKRERERMEEERETHADLCSSVPSGSKKKVCREESALKGLWVEEV